MFPYLCFPTKQNFDDFIQQYRCVEVIEDRVPRSVDACWAYTNWRMTHAGATAKSPIKLPFSSALTSSKSLVLAP